MRMNDPVAPARAIEFTLDGESVPAFEGESILQAAQRHGVEIPHLCHKDGLRPDGNCRACVVEVKGERTLAPSCCREVKPGMEVASRSERAVRSQKMVVELLLADATEGAHEGSELAYWAGQLGVRAPRFEARASRPADFSHPAIAINPDACIQCMRCLRACREEQANDVLGMAFRGTDAVVAADLGDRLGDSTCVACGECVQACPTGALTLKSGAGVAADRTVDSVCPYCGVGCRLTYHIKGERIVRVEGRDGPANERRLCVKGRFGFDYVHNAQRLTMPLVRKAGVPKGAALIDPQRWHETFREATWEEALELAAGKLRAIRDTHGPKALCGLGSAKGSNEEAYLFQKLVRTGFRTNNVDHCTRLCHASSVAALLEGIGSGSVSNPVVDVLHSEVLLVIGSNAPSNHPVAATWIRNAVNNGTRLIVADPRRTDLARYAQHHLQFKPGADVALLNAMLHTIIKEGLVDEAFIAARTTGYEDIVRNAGAHSPEAMAPICGIAPETIREVARLYAKSKASMILWGMGVTQHVHGTDNVRCLVALALVTGQIGRPGTGLHPLRGQNNVQGASDAGLIPMMYPDYQRVSNAEARERFQALWSAKLDPEPGLTVVEMMDAMHAGAVKGLYIMGENPAMSDPDLNHVREALARLDWLVVQDIFLTETAGFADVILPASAFAEKTGTFTNTDRCVQLGRAALKPPGEAREDLWVLNEMARRLGLEWNYAHAREVFAEMRRAQPSIAGITWERLEAEHGVTHPCRNEGDPGERILFTQRFPTPTGKARLVPASVVPPDERPDAEYPMVLITGRQLEHWHTGSMTRRSTVLDAIESEPVALVNPADLRALGVRAGDVITVASRRGEVSLFARADEGTPVGAVFIPFCYREAAANILTNPALDPFGKIPELKNCAVRVTRGGRLAQRAAFEAGASNHYPTPARA